MVDSARFRWLRGLSAFHEGNSVDLVGGVEVLLLDFMQRMRASTFVSPQCNSEKACSKVEGTTLGVAFVRCRLKETTLASSASPRLQNLEKAQPPRGAPHLDPKPEGQQPPLEFESSQSGNPERPVA